MSRQKLASSRAWKRAHPERHAELARAYRARNREKTRAQNQLNYALRMGRMQRLPCEKCGSSEKVHAHHHDYSKPFDVRWLCYLCHKAEHPVSEADKKVKFKGATQARGERHGKAKLTGQQVRQIRALLNIGLSFAKIGRMFGVSSVTIGHIKSGTTWRHIKD